MAAENRGTETARVQSDAILCRTDQLAWISSVGHGEVKPVQHKRNIDALASDMFERRTSTIEDTRGSSC